MSDDDTKAVLSAARERSTALVRGDRQRLSELCTRQFVYTNASGQVFNLPEYLRFYIESGDMRWSSQELSDAQVHCYGSSAILTCLVWDKASHKGDVFEATFRSTQVWVREGREWKCAAIQTTEVR